MASDDRLDALRKRLRLVAQRAADAGADVMLRPQDLLALLDALGRATQGADRLRRQNRRLRLRCQRKGVELDDGGGDGDEA